MNSAHNSKVNSSLQGSFGNQKKESSMTSALSAALKKPTLDQGASTALADSLKAPQKAATPLRVRSLDNSTTPLQLFRVSTTTQALKRTMWLTLTI